MFKDVYFCLYLSNENKLPEMYDYQSSVHSLSQSRALESCYGTRFLFVQI